MNLETAPNQSAAIGSDGKGVLIAKFSRKFGVDREQLFSILKSTCFKQAPGTDGAPPAEVTNEQMAALLVVSDQYNLNPFTREIYAFPDKKNGIVPVVGVDGWMRIINGNPALDGLEFRESPTSIKIDDDAKECPEWMEAVIYRKDRARPIVVREYLDECYRPAFVGKYGKIKGPWQTHTKRFLRHKTLLQGARIAFGFAGVYDEDEAERIVKARVLDMTSGMPAAIDVTGEHQLPSAADALNARITTIACDQSVCQPPAMADQMRFAKAEILGDDAPILPLVDEDKSTSPPDETEVLPNQPGPSSFGALDTRLQSVAWSNARDANILKNILRKKSSANVLGGADVIGITNMQR